MVYIYFFIAFLPLAFTSLFIKRKQDRLLAKIMLVFYVLIYGLNYRSGVDWYAYEPIYYGKNLLPFEYGYDSLQKTFSSLNIDFWFFSFFIKSFFWIACYKVTKKYSQYICAPLFFLMMLSPIFLTDVLRQMISASIFFIALINIDKRNAFSFSLIIAFSALFHISALLVLPFYFVYKYRIIRTVFLIVSIIFFILGFTNFSPIHELIQITGLLIPGPFYEKIALYASIERYPMSIGHILRFLILIIYFIYFRKKIKKDQNIKVIACALLFLIGYEMIFYDINTLWTRSREYFLIFLPIAILSFSTYYKYSKILLFLALSLYSTHAYSGLKNDEILWKQYGSYCNHLYMLANECSNYEDTRYNETKSFWDNRSLKKR